MKKNHLIAILLFLLSIGTISGFLVKMPKYWIGLDFAVIVVCSVCGIMLLINKK